MFRVHVPVIFYFSWLQHNASCLCSNETAVLGQKSNNKALRVCQKWLKLCILSTFILSWQNWITNVGCSDLGKDSPAWTETARTIQVRSRNDLLTSADPHADSSVHWSLFTYSHFRCHFPKFSLEICNQIWRYVHQWEETLPSSQTPRVSYRHTKCARRSRMLGLGCSPTGLCSCTHQQAQRQREQRKHAVSTA